MSPVGSEVLGTVVVMPPIGSHAPGAVVPPRLPRLPGSVMPRPMGDPRSVVLRRLPEGTVVLGREIVDDAPVSMRTGRLPSRAVVFGHEDVGGAVVSPLVLAATGSRGNRRQPACGHRCRRQTNRYLVHHNGYFRAEHPSLLNQTQGLPASCSCAAQLPGLSCLGSK